MVGEQLFIGGVAVLLGLLASWASLSNHDRFYQLPKIRWLEDRWGRTTARVIYVILGVALLGLGAYVLLGMQRNG